MKRILAIAVDTTPTKNCAVVRSLIKADRVKEARPYIAGLIAGLERLGHQRGSDFEIDYVTCEPADLKKGVKAAIDAEKPDAIFVCDGAVYTSAGVTAGIDLALALVEEDLGHDAALAVARQLVVFLKRPGGQSQFSSALAAQTVAPGPLKGLPEWIVANPSIRPDFVDRGKFQARRTNRCGSGNAHDPSLGQDE